MLVCPQCGQGWLRVTVSVPLIWDQRACVLDADYYDTWPSVKDIKPDTPVQCEECGWTGVERDLEGERDG